ncbi:SPOR domain-containing protein [Pseudemcibacter aquimaris]|uniref:SPOR domain-containing protein n=1 Tax=Pseudemcibacter aquimaris TaxID=2857064 RepID=UPI00201164C0|nr:SPOR domain-containing protein [Pseudemcibacter aquimaris]MCC3859609.1 SPOR domain-containing protein [Pseudemcibacter aquimaris]WDU60004.1 SPOR domain-containing protein [Pseudemcibacter aquimaris]
MNMLQYCIKYTFLKNAFLSILLVFSLSACSTIDNFLGGGLNDPSNLEGETASDMGEGQSNTMLIADETMPATAENEQSVEEMLQEKDNALIEQGMRIAAAERELANLKEQNSSLQQELNRALDDAAQKQRMLDQQAERQVNTSAATQSSRMQNITAPNGGFGLHVASYSRRDSISSGLAAINRQVPVLTEGRPLKIATATVRGRTYYRLIIGQFNLQSEALAECNQAKLLIDFCDVVAFEGEDF